MNAVELYLMFAFFLIYSFLGWCVEVAYHAVTFGKVVNRGFLNGPVCPIYGFGMLAVIALLLPVEEHLALLFLGGMFLASALELVRRKKEPETALENLKEFVREKGESFRR